MHESMNPKRIKESALFHLDGRLVLVLEALQDGKAKVKVSVCANKVKYIMFYHVNNNNSFKIVGEADELVVPVSRLSLKPTHDETDMDVILEINELALAVMKTLNHSLDSLFIFSKTKFYS